MTAAAAGRLTESPPGPHSTRPGTYNPETTAAEPRPARPATRSPRAAYLPRHNADRFDWERIIRRCPLTAHEKLVALTLATYADANGGNIYPGRSKLAAVTGLSKRTVTRHLDRLRDGLGLIDRTQRGRRAGQADLYRLTFPTDSAVLGTLIGVEDEALPTGRPP